MGQGRAQWATPWDRAPQEKQGDMMPCAYWPGTGAPCSPESSWSKGSTRLGTGLGSRMGWPKLPGESLSCVGHMGRVAALLFLPWAPRPACTSPKAGKPGRALGWVDAGLGGRPRLLSFLNGVTLGLWASLSLRVLSWELSSNLGACRGAQALCAEEQQAHDGRASLTASLSADGGCRGPACTSAATPNSSVATPLPGPACHGPRSSPVLLSDAGAHG